MPLIETKGAGSAQGFGEFTKTGPKVYIEDVFSTYLYTGTGAAQTITNGIDLSTKGGLVWCKDRGATTNHILQYDTSTLLRSNLTDAAVSTSGVFVNAFNANGFSVSTGLNTSAAPYVSWTFRKQPKFFDVVTYTGTGSATTIAHSLGATPGCIIVKRTDTTSNWQVYHSGLTSAAYSIQLNLTSAQASATTVWNSTAPTASVFSVGTDATVNASGGTYVAYLFASNAGGFGLTGADNVITCGSFATDSSGIYSVTLGYEPQWVMIKRSDGTGSWFIQDNMRGMTTTNGPALLPNTSGAEGTPNDRICPNATGFYSNNTGGTIDGSATYIYIAIRRGPMKTPTTGTSVFTPVSRAGTSANALVTANFPVDLSLIGESTGASYDKFLTTDRLRGTSASLETRATFAEFDATTSFQTNAFDSNVALKIGTGTGTNSSTTNYANWLFARAPSFFDEVCYTGTGTTTTVNHNLGVVPELMIIKDRGNHANPWKIGYYLSASQVKEGYLNTTAAFLTYNWTSSTFANVPTSTVFSLGPYGEVNDVAYNYVAYLFATCAGVSKVGSYTGTGASQVINCGFTGGARFVLIKRTDLTGDWYVYDTARGMVSGTDPYLFMNSLTAQVNADYVFTSSTGFTIQAAAPAGINANGGTYIFLAIA